MPPMTRFAAPLALSLLCLVTVACGSAARRGDGTMPANVLERSDPSADTSDHPSTSHGGCGGVFDPCPDVTARRTGGGCGFLWMFPCSSSSSVSVGCGACSQAGGAGGGVALSLAVLACLLRRRRRPPL